jgi:hypothetical protein
MIKGVLQLRTRLFGMLSFAATQNPHDAHRPLQDGEDLATIFSWQEERKLSRNLTILFKRATYLIEPSPDTLPLAGSIASESRMLRTSARVTRPRTI